MIDPLLFGASRLGEEDVARQVLDVLRFLIFGDAIAILKKNNAQARKPGVLANAAVGALLEAIRSGRVQYEDGVFSGKFSAAISGDILSLGAEFDGRASVYRINPARVPAWVTAEAAVYASQARAMHASIIKGLDDAQENLDSRLETKSVDATLSIGELASGWKDAATALQVNPELSHQHLERLRRKYDDNIKLTIKTFASDEIKELRQVVRDNAMQGYRADRLIKAIEARYDVSKNKATFLAEQETSLLVSKFREERFRETIGDRYTWMTSHDGRVRHDHKMLDGTEQSYNNPPITNRETGDRNNPGEDFRCRCIARPILGAGRRLVAA